jgi:hypothetical protein
MLLRGRRPVVKVGGVAGERELALFVAFDELQSARDHATVPVARRGSALDCVLEVEQRPGLISWVAVGDQHCPALGGVRDDDRGSARLLRRAMGALARAAPRVSVQRQPCAPSRRSPARSGGAAGVSGSRARGVRPAHALISNRPVSRRAILPPASRKASRKKARMKCGCNRRALASSMRKRTSSTSPGLRTSATSARSRRRSCSRSPTAASTTVSKCARVSGLSP